MTIWIVFAFLIGIFAVTKAWHAVVESAVRLILHWTSPNWIPGIELSRAFGSIVYGVLRRLERFGELERRTEPGGPERGGHERAYYRGAPVPGTSQDKARVLEEVVQAIERVGAKYKDRDTGAFGKDFLGELCDEVEKLAEKT